MLLRAQPLTVQKLSACCASKTRSSPPCTACSPCLLLLYPCCQVSGDLDSLTDDLAHVVAGLPGSPVLVAHSFGALLAEKYMTGGWTGFWGSGVDALLHCSQLTAGNLW